MLALVVSLHSPIPGVGGLTRKLSDFTSSSIIASLRPRTLLWLGWRNNIAVPLLKAPMDNSKKVAQDKNEIEHHRRRKKRDGLYTFFFLLLHDTTTPWAITLSFHVTSMYQEKCTSGYQATPPPKDMGEGESQQQNKQRTHLPLETLALPPYPSHLGIVQSNRSFTLLKEKRELGRHLNHGTFLPLHSWWLQPIPMANMIRSYKTRGREAILGWHAWENRCTILNWRPFLFFYLQADCMHL